MPDLARAPERLHRLDRLAERDRAARSAPVDGEDFSDTQTVVGDAEAHRKQTVGPIATPAPPQQWEDDTTPIGGQAPRKKTSR